MQNAISFAGDEFSQRTLPQSQYPRQVVMPESQNTYYPDLYGQYQHFCNQQNTELAVKAQQSALKVQTAKEIETIQLQAAYERKAQSLDLQVKHENRTVEVIRGGDGSPVLRSEMLHEKDWLKPVADISQCSAVLYTSDIYKPKDSVLRIIEVRLHNNQTHEDMSIYHDITIPDDKAFQKCLMANRIKLKCGRRKQLEYAGKLLEWFEEIATTVTIPRQRGFVFIMENDTLKIDYISEKEVTWEEMMKLCL